MRKSVCRFVPVLILLITLALPASAAVYDFSGLGAASGGFKPQGNRFLVSELFANDGTSMYYDDGGANQTVNGMIIKPDGTNLSSFDLGNLTVSPYDGSYTVSITVHADLKAGGTTSQSVSNYGLTAATALTTMGMNFSAFDDVTELRIDLTVAGDKVWNINFNNITITDEQAPVVPGVEPTTQATDLTAASAGTSVINIFWENGDGARRVVFAKQGNTGTPTVTDGTVYTAGANGAIVGQTYQTVSRGENGSDVTARPESGYRFVRWSDGVTTATRRDVNVTGDIAVTAEFSAIWTPGGELPDDLDLDGNGTPDQDQGNIAVVSNGSGLYFGVVLPDEIVLEYLEWIDAATVADTDNRPDAFPLGLASFRVLTAFVGDTIELTIYCSQPIPQGAIWYKHDPSNGWYDYSAQAVISDDRLSVTLTLRDGGIGDADGMENGIIEDPSGPALFNGNDGDDNTGSHGGGGGGCFLRSLGAD